MEKTFLQTLNFYRGRSALQISPSPELALVFVSLAPVIPGMENKMPDKNSKKYQWDKKLTASFNFDGALEIAAAAAALAEGREGGSWFPAPTAIFHPGTGTRQRPAAMEPPRRSAFIGPRTNRKLRRFRYFLGITENSKDKQGNKIGISLEYPDLFKIARVMEEAALAILGWRKDIEERKEGNGRSASDKAEAAEAF